MDEIGTRLVPWEHIEVTHARNRPYSERPPLPEPGDVVWYRRFEWNRDPLGTYVDPELVTVVEVQPVDDTTPADFADGVEGLVRDPNLWHLIRDEDGRPLRDLLGQPRYTPVADPWPWVRLRRPNGIVDETRESRLRGAAGWLPLDYLTRSERWRLPSATLTAIRPLLRPLNVPEKPAPAPGR